VAEACAAILREVAPSPVELVPIGEALGRVLATDLVASVELPPWDNASMDGYAVRAADIANARPASAVRLRVTGTIAAGAHVSERVGVNEAMRIMTGAPVPAGADSVVRVEDTDAGVDVVSVLSDRDAGRNVRPRGEDIQAGAIAAQAGDVLHPGMVGFLASLGFASVPVHRRPRVAILASGDELVEVDRFDEVQAGRRIVTSNSYSLVAAVTDAGGMPLNLGHVSDDPAAIRGKLADVECDLLLTTGGVSVGEFDHIRGVLAELGAEHRFWRVRIRPGAPLGFGLFRGRPWLGLPGNPVSTLVTFELFARPAIRKMLGHRHFFRRGVPVRLAEPITISAPLTHFLRARLEYSIQGVEARLTGPQGSGLMSSMARADALLVVPADATRIEAGRTVQALILGSESGYVDFPPAE
jgi:molybdopterin molybdotransferase